MFEIRVRLSRSQILATEILLEDLGANAISLEDAEDQPMFVEEVGNTPLWPYTTLTALFSQEPNIHNLQQRLEEALTASIEINKKEILEQDWQKQSMQNFQPIQFGERLWVCPTWANYPDPFAINIRLAPGLAFGTGSHATTSLCLEWLNKCSLSGNTVMDFGCGSGILAIAAYFLGAKKIYAIDHDPQAVQATQMNAKNNQVDESVLQINLASTPTQQNCDIIIANVLLQPLIELSTHFAERLSPASKLILSGILEQQLEQLQTAYQPYFEFDAIHSKNEWLLVEASLNS